MSAAETTPSASSRGAADVTVAAGVEAALADVQRQLARQAPALRLVHPAPSATPVTLVATPAPAPPPSPPKPPKPARARRAPVRPVAPVPLPPVEADEYDEYDDETFDDELAADDVVMGDGVPPASTAPLARAARRPVERRIDLDELSPDQRAALGRLQARKVGRVVRDVSPWSVFKFSVLFWVCVWLILTVAGVILWKVGEGAGVVTNVEKFYAKASGEKTFEIDGRGVFRAGAAIGVLLAAAMTGISVLIAVLFNLVSDLTGGIRMSVVELESTRRPIRASRAAVLAGRASSARAAPAPAPEAATDEAPGGRRSPSGSGPASRRDPASPTDDDAEPVAPPAVPTLVPESLLDAEDEAGGVRSAAR